MSVNTLYVTEKDKTKLLQGKLKLLTLLFGNDCISMGVITLVAGQKSHVAISNIRVELK